MKLRHEQLANHLQKNLAPIYVISGEEPLLVQEATETIRHRARNMGYHERKSFQVDNQFDWHGFMRETRSLSLFSQRRLFELQLKQFKFTNEHARLLQEYAKQPVPETLLILVSHQKLDASTQQSAWYKAIDNVGVIIPIWPIEFAQLPQWIAQRCQKLDLHITPASADRIAHHVTGNLFAAAQEVEKLYLLYGAGALNNEQITDAITDNARFDIFQLADACLAGDSEAAMRILHHLRDTGVEPTLVLWVIAKELRTLASITFAKSQGHSLTHVFREQRVWEKRQALVKQASQRYSTKIWQQLLGQASHVDAMIKGAAQGNVWDELLQLCLQIAGIKW